MAFLWTVSAMGMFAIDPFLFLETGEHSDSWGKIFIAKYILNAASFTKLIIR